jgi:hypothetical protein
MLVRSWLAFAFLSLVALAGCGARSNVFQPEEGADGAGRDARSDGRDNDGRLRRDVPVDWLAPDQRRDKLVWPEGPKKKDGWPWPVDSYPGAAPAGCQSEADCFGQRCCPTPWNVNLCAPECPQF